MELVRMFVPMEINRNRTHRRLDMISGLYTPCEGLCIEHLTRFVGHRGNVGFRNQIVSAEKLVTSRDAKDTDTVLSDEFHVGNASHRELMWHLHAVVESADDVG